MSKIRLPIDSFLAEIAEAFASQQNLILRSSPGSGKTTRVPPLLLSHTQGRILVLEPRRVAARMAASRVAQELGAGLGGLVGYHIRQEKRWGSHTRLSFITEGLLLRYLLADPLLQGVTTVILDEFHERHLHSDVALACLRNLQTTSRPDLKIVVMSATLAVEGLQRFLGEATLLDFAAPHYPVVTTYLAKELSQPLASVIAARVEQFLSRTGDILVFLPGRREIDRVCEEIQMRRLPVEVLPFYGELPMQEQVRALCPIPGKKRVVVATNLAESSLTVDGVSTVIDSGLHRQARVSPWSGAALLETRPIAKASAIQRAGRAGRQGPGVCLRLYTEADFKARLDFEVPEIHRAELSHTALEILALGAVQGPGLQWLEPPREGAWQSALSLLERLGAVKNQKLTPMGKWMAQAPCSPRLARSLLMGVQLGVAEALIPRLANLSEGDVANLNVLDASQVRTVRAKRMAQTLSELTAELTRERLAELELTAERIQPRETQEHRMLRSLLAGFPDRVGKVRRRGNEWVEVALAISGAVVVTRLDSFWEQEHDYILVLEAFETKHKGNTMAKAQVVAHVEEDWLLASSLAHATSALRWDGKKIIQSAALMYEGLTLLEDVSSPTSQQAEMVAHFWVDEILGLRETGDILRALDKLDPFLDRQRLAEDLARWKLACEYGLLGEEKSQLILADRRWLYSALRGVLEVQSLATLDWLGCWIHEAGFGELEYAVRSRLDQELPLSLAIGTRPKVKIHYEWDRSPWLESRIQDFFGMKQGPSLLQGKLPIVLHLLAPNHRAVQVTQDLNGFWLRHYSTVRQELKRRYPRHKWPEDPLG